MTKNPSTIAPDEVREFLAKIGRKGGQHTSRRKTKSSRANGKLGGRPSTKKEADRAEAAG